MDTLAADKPNAQNKKLQGEMGKVQADLENTKKELERFGAAKRQFQKLFLQITIVPMTNQPAIKESISVNSYCEIFRNQNFQITNSICEILMDQIYQN